MVLWLKKEEENHLGIFNGIFFKCAINVSVTPFTILEMGLKSHYCNEICRELGAILAHGLHVSCRQKYLLLKTTLFFKLCHHLCLPKNVDQQMLLRTRTS